MYRTMAIDSYRYPSFLRCIVLLYRSGELNLHNTTAFTLYIQRPDPLEVYSTVAGWSYIEIEEFIT